jgi:hypothetical protein
MCWFMQLLFLCAVSIAHAACRCEGYCVCYLLATHLLLVVRAHTTFGGPNLHVRDDVLLPVVVFSFNLCARASRMSRRFAAGGALQSAALRELRKHQVVHGRCGVGAGVGGSRRMRCVVECLVGLNLALPHIHTASGSCPRRPSQQSLSAATSTEGYFQVRFVHTGYWYASWGGSKSMVRTATSGCYSYNCGARQRASCCVACVCCL